MMTILLAKIFGIYFLVVGVALLLNPGRFRAWYNEYLRNDGNVLIGAVMALLIGAFILSVHHVWVLDWPVLFTLIGYFGVIKGAGLMIVPGFVDLFRPMIDASPMVYRASGLVWALIGLFLFVQGWM